MSIFDVKEKLASIIKEKSEPPKTTGASSASNPDLLPGERKPDEKKTKTLRLTTTKDMPKYSEILSNPGGVFEVQPKQKNDFVVVLTGKKTCGIAVSGSQFGSHHFMTLKAGIEGSGWHVDFVAVTDAGLVSALYQNSSVADSVGVDSEFIKRFDELVSMAVKTDISDIHIEKRESDAHVRLRRHGDITPHLEWSSAYAMQFARAVYTIADEDSKDTLFSDGGGQQMSISRSLADGGKVKLRVQTMPAYPDGGIDIIMRVLKIGAASKVRTLVELGYESDHIRMLDYMMSSPSGVIVVAGTTGSGKSTSLQTMMSGIRQKNAGFKMYSVEDPPEYIIHGVTQVPVKRREGETGNPFARTMKDLMRGDPDVCMVGEIRDVESAACLVSLTQSGHKVLTTVHAISALGIFERFSKMGIDLPTLSSHGFVSGLMYQTLVQSLCEHCKAPYTNKLHLPDLGVHDRIKSVTRPGESIFLRGAGCSICAGTGVSGRTVCAEMVIPDRKMLGALRRSDMAGAYDHWRGSRKPNTGLMSGMSALDHAIIKMRRGEVSPEDVESALGLLTGYHNEAEIDDDFN